MESSIHAAVYGATPAWLGSERVDADGAQPHYAERSPRGRTKPVETTAAPRRPRDPAA